ncbi:unnamed protein product [Cuscuta epithymum]|uniref:Reverse transcriptase domain-containing protein n=1 Tax=Cuscuta epithymum TaxID=186058 RepID=A0AAV0EIM0_9ASTE|nr:unnamed protein product [Cuscuta epithymum]
MDDVWLSMESTFNKVAKEILGESKGCLPPKKDTSWWNDEVKQAIRIKRECYKKLGKSWSDENIEEYKEARKRAKKTVKEARGKVNKELYAKLNSKEGEKDIYRLARLRDRRTQDIGKVKCVKDVDQRVLMEDGEIKERRRSYFDTLFNGNKARYISDLTISDCMVNRDFVRRIQTTEVKEALRKMGRKKAVGPDDILIEAWRSLGERGVEWLTSFFNMIWRNNKMPTSWRKSTLIPLFKNKGDVQECANYRGIKLMSHTMKPWEGVIEQRLRRTVKISENQFGFMPGRSTSKAIHLLRQLIKKYRDSHKDLHLVFIDLEKAYDRVPQEVLWWSLIRKGISREYISIIMDMYEDCTTSVSTNVGGLRSSILLSKCTKDRL